MAVNVYLDQLYYFTVQKMKLYLIGGLGADYRVFEKLNLNVDCIVVEWVPPIADESLQSYVIRLSAQIDQKKEFGLLGVSFGGIIIAELAKIVNANICILVSSVTSSDQLPGIYVGLGKTGILNFVPDFLIRPPRMLQKFLFGAEDHDLLARIIKDTDPGFIRWALGVIIHWQGTNLHQNLLRIHGSHDRLIPLKGEAIIIAKGSHFMIVDNAEEISHHINKHLRLQTT